MKCLQKYAVLLKWLRMELFFMYFGSMAPYRAFDENAPWISRREEGKSAS